MKLKIGDKVKFTSPDDGVLAEGTVVGFAKDVLKKWPGKYLKLKDSDEVYLVKSTSATNEVRFYALQPMPLREYL